MDWDIAFYSTTLTINGGVVVVPIPIEPNKTANCGAYLLANITFEAIIKADETKFVKDKKAGYAIPKGSGNGWYTYTIRGHPIIMLYLHLVEL